MIAKHSQSRDENELIALSLLSFSYKFLTLALETAFLSEKNPCICVQLPLSLIISLLFGHNLHTMSVHCYWMVIRFKTPGEKWCLVRWRKRSKKLKTQFSTNKLWMITILSPYKKQSWILDLIHPFLIKMICNAKWFLPDIFGYSDLFCTRVLMLI